MAEIHDRADGSIYLKKQVVADEILISAPIGIEWHVWPSRLLPYRELKAGDRVIMVDGGPDSGSLIWEVEVREVARGWCDDVEHGWQLVSAIAAGAGLTEEAFRADPFTRRLAGGGRRVLAWTYRPVGRIDQPRVRGEHDLARHGWSAITRPHSDGLRERAAREPGGTREGDSV